MLKTKAFTMAEVLVSLTIIGVIASLTIPAVMYNTTKKTNQALLKKALVKLDTVVEMAYTESEFQPFNCFYWENGSPTGCKSIPQYDDNGKIIGWENENCQEGENPNGKFANCQNLYNYIKNNLKTVKTCDNNAFINECAPDYKGIDSVYEEKNPPPDDNATEEEKKTWETNKSNDIVGCSGWTYENMKKKPAIVTSDGMIFIPYAVGTPIFAIDVNGKKEPNRFGYDVFFLILKGTDETIPGFTTGGCDYYEKGGVSTSTMLNGTF